MGSTGTKEYISFGPREVRKGIYGCIRPIGTGNDVAEGAPASNRSNVPSPSSGYPSPFLFVSSAPQLPGMQGKV